MFIERQKKSAQKNLSDLDHERTFRTSSRKPSDFNFFLRANKYKFQISSFKLKEIKQYIKRKERKLTTLLF